MPMIRFLKNYRHYRVGDVVQTSDARAAELIADGTAESREVEVLTATVKRPHSTRKAAINPTPEGE